MKDEFKRSSNKDCSVGGYKCQCCGPAPKERDEFRRIARHRLRAQDKKLIEEELNG